MKVPGPELRLKKISEVIALGDRAIGSGDGCFDFSEVIRADSSAVAALLHWMRACRAKGIGFSAVSLPQGLADLCRLYGVDGILLTDASSAK